MTYPYPQQDPYNQYPQSGGYPAQPGYPQTGGFPQPGGGYPPPPPPKSNTTLIVSIVAVVVLALGALGITGFVAPGFFLSNDKESGGNGGDNATGPEALAQAIVSGLNNKDQAALGALRCPDAEEDVGEVISQVAMVQSAQLAGPVQQQDDTHASANVNVVTQQGQLTASGEMVKQAEKWCWHAVSMGGDLPGAPSTAPSAPSIPNTVPPVDPSAPSAPGGGSSDLNSLMETFLTAINSGDASGAQATMCADGAMSSAQDAIDKKVDLKLDSPPETTGTFVIGDVSGTNGDGSRTIGSIDAEREDETSPWCIEELRLY